MRLGLHIGYWGLGLTADEQRVMDVTGAFLRELETTEMTKCFKMVTLEVLLERDHVLDGISLEDLAARSHALLRRSPELLADVPEEMRVAPDDDVARARWLAYWKKNPIAAWTSRAARLLLLYLFYAKRP